MEIIIQATILPASNLFYLRSTEYYFHTYSQLEFLFQPHNHAALKMFKMWPSWCKHNRRQTVHANVTKSPDKNRNCDVWSSDSGAAEHSSITGHDAALVGKYSYRRVGGLACLHFHSLCSPKDPENGESRHPRDVVTICQSTRCIPEDSFLEARSYKRKQAATEGSHKRGGGKNFTIKTWKHRRVCKKWLITIPLQAWTGPEVSRKLRLPDFKTIDI
jgi:hypothetical protein